MLRRRHVNTRKLRLEYLRIKPGVVKTASDFGELSRTDLERARDLAKTQSLKTEHPGHIIGMDGFYVGTLKGLGRIFPITAIDTYSSYCLGTTLHRQISTVRL